MVTATDGGPLPKSDREYLTVRVARNLFPPVIAETLYQWEIQENHDVNSEVDRITATDKDTKVKYSDFYGKLQIRAVRCLALFEGIVKIVNKGKGMETQHIFFIDKWSLFRGFFVLFYLERDTEVWPLFKWLSLFRGCF